MAAMTLPSTCCTPLNSASKFSSPSTLKKKRKLIICRAEGKGPSSSPESNSKSSNSNNNDDNNILLKLAWYGSEALGIAASAFRPSKAAIPPERQQESSAEYEVAGSIPRDVVVDAIKKDFQRSYFVTGNLTMAIYKEDCEFADPAGSFKGLRRFKRNCSNFGSLLKTSNMKLMDWKDFEDRGVGYWRFICVLAFPWKPILSATGYTEYYYDAESGKICRETLSMQLRISLAEAILSTKKGIYLVGLQMKWSGTWSIGTSQKWFC